MYDNTPFRFQKVKVNLTRKGCCALQRGQIVAASNDKDSSFHQTAGEKQNQQCTCGNAI